MRNIRYIAGLWPVRLLIIAAIAAGVAVSWGRSGAKQEQTVIGSASFFVVPERGGTVSLATADGSRSGIKDGTTDVRLFRSAEDSAKVTLVPVAASGWEFDRWNTSADGAIYGWQGDAPAYTGEARSGTHAVWPCATSKCSYVVAAFFRPIDIEPTPEFIAAPTVETTPGP